MSRNSLEQFIQETTGENHLRVQDDLGDGFVRLRAAEAQRRQAQQDIQGFEDVVIEMLRNSRDAHANCIFVATWKEGQRRFLTMIDNGSGIPDSMHEVVFEPFVTSKLDTFHSDRWGVHGRGMALYSIRENTDVAKILDSKPGFGTVMRIEADAATLGEKKDQSTIPRISKDEQGSMVLRGPHNIVRVALEFAVDQRKETVVYFGSPTEIASTLYDFGKKTCDLSKTSFVDSLEEVPYIQRLAFATSPEDFADIALQLGLPMSSRSARRIMDGEILPLQPHIECLIQKPDAQKPSPAKSTGKSKVKLSEEDREAFSQGVMKCYEHLANSYYLNPDVTPHISASRETLKISIPLILTE